MLSAQQIEQPININDILGRLGYPQSPSELPQEGVSFVSSTNSKGTSNTDTNAKSASTITIPNYWNWQNVIDSTTKHPIIRSAGTQYGCACCYAIGVISQLEDRLTIASKKASPFLSYTSVLSCNDKSNISNGCAGGNCADVAQFIATNGLVHYLCQNFDWCIFNPGCAFGTNASSQNNNLIPLCSNKCETCYSNGFCEDVSNFVIRQLFFIDSTSIKTYGSIPDIQRDIMTNGPCGCTCRIPMDFILGAIPNSKYPKANSWALTNNVYINIPGADLYDMGSLDGQLICDTFTGNHSTVAVGWSSTMVKHPKIQNGTPTKIDYWIVRNSWTDAWNAPQAGFFNIAMTNAQMGINTELYFDNFLNTAGIQFGGSISVLPTTETVKRIMDNDAYQSLNFNIDDARDPAKEPPLLNTPLPTTNSTNSSSSSTSLNLQIKQSSLPPLPLTSAPSTAPNPSTTIKSSSSTKTLIIVSTILGALLIGAFIAIGILATKKSRKR